MKEKKRCNNRLIYNKSSYSMFVFHISQKLHLVGKITRKRHLFQALIVKTLFIEQIFFCFFNLVWASFLHRNRPSVYCIFPTCSTILLLRFTRCQQVYIHVHVFNVYCNRIYLSLKRGNKFTDVSITGHHFAFQVTRLRHRVTYFAPHVQHSIMVFELFI